MHSSLPNLFFPLHWISSFARESLSYSCLAVFFLSFFLGLWAQFRLALLAQSYQAIVHVRHQSVSQSLISCVPPWLLLQASLWTHTPVWTPGCRWTGRAAVTTCPSARCWGSRAIQATGWVTTSRWCARGTTGGATPSQAAMVRPDNTPLPQPLNAVNSNVLPGLSVFQYF